MICYFMMSFIQGRGFSHKKTDKRQPCNVKEIIWWIIFLWCKNDLGTVVQHTIYWFRLITHVTHWYIQSKSIFYSLRVRISWWICFWFAKRHVQGMERCFLKVLKISQMFSRSSFILCKSFVYLYLSLACVDFILNEALGSFLTNLAWISGIYCNPLPLLLLLLMLFKVFAFVCYANSYSFKVAAAYFF